MPGTSSTETGTHGAGAYPDPAGRTNVFYQSNYGIHGNNGTLMINENTTLMGILPRQANYARGA